MDADVCVAELGLIYMKGAEAHAGFPEISYGMMSDKLVSLGYRVARVEQTETPQQLKERNASAAKGVKKDGAVRRDLCGIKSRGTRTGGVLDVYAGKQADTAAAAVDAQRGAGSHGASVEALRRLNALGYGRPDAPHLRLDLIANPVGLALPVPEAALEARFRAELAALPGGAPVVFNQLLTLTNMPIKRFADDLARKGQLAQYVSLLAMNLNPATIPLLMCRSTASVDWRGHLFDCDFNQALGLPLLADEGQEGDVAGSAAGGGGGGGGGLPPAGQRPLTIFDVASFSDAALEGRPVRTHKACFGCTAGAGSSCGGALL